MFALQILVLFVFLQNTTAGDIMARFDKWINEFKVRIENQKKYYELYEKWESNDHFIEDVNFRNLTYKLGHNQFSGMDSNDFRKYLGYSNLESSNLRRRKTSTLDQQINVYDLPSSINWVEKGAVTPVKDQGQCGSCWSFSTTGALEGAYYNKYGNLQSFSEQQLVDCDNFKNGGRDHGCNGGLMDNAFAWISKNGGLCIENDYPYISGNTETSGTCKQSCETVSDSKIVSFVDVTTSSDLDMMQAIASQPVSIAIEADQREFQLYKSGVFTATCGTNLDHGVLVVGYGSDDGSDYYLVKNSWGESWGQDGYILLGRGSQYNNGDGQCGLLLQGSYPIL
jgi:C1A family cysteine protease